MPQDFVAYSDIENPASNLFSVEMWKEVQQLTAFECFENLQEDIVKNISNWERFIRLQNIEALPEPYHSQLQYFSWIPLVKVLKPELTTQAIRRLVKKSLGSYFVIPQITHLRSIYDQSSPQTPILLLLTPGNDPMEQIRKLGEEKQRIPYPVSLGKGQGEKAKLNIAEVRKNGGWVVLQNCHLGSSFLPELEQIVENLEVKVKDNQIYESKKGEEPPHADFRLWLTSMSIENFPLTVLQKSIKVTSEPPKGIKSSLLRTYGQIVSNKNELEYYDSCKKQEIWQPMFFALSYFHAIIRERRRFGQLGWNLSTYDFNDSDFKVSSRQLFNMIDNNEEVPFEALRYLCGECNYGGRVTDDMDRRALTTILKTFYNKNVITQNPYEFTEQQDLKPYSIVRLERAKEYLEFCQKLPDAEDENPQIVGLHQNASIIQSKGEAHNIFQLVLKLNQNDKKVDRNKLGALNLMIQQILDQLKESFTVKEVELKFPFTYQESMNGVLLQELARYNQLLKIIFSSLHTLLRTLDGKIISTQEMEELQFCISNNQVPSTWLQRSYPTRKSLILYVQDLSLRLKMFDDWIQYGQPQVFWISGFFFTHSFLAGVKQNFARQHKYPFDKVDFEFKITKRQHEEQLRQLGASCGNFVEGLYLEGAGWDDTQEQLCESTLKTIHVKMPIMHLIPVINKDELMKSRVYYICPTYVTSQRSGTLSTTGHSTNFIMTVELPCQQNSFTSMEGSTPEFEVDWPSHWIQRSVALLSQLDD